MTNQSEDNIRALAIYLPQFHPIKENNDWWGEGYTEWTNVAKSKPLFENHYQPHIPADLGFYDLRLDETRIKQAEMAKEYGISGFCYYYYWFNGKQLLETPIKRLLETKKPDFPFCVCWANENWTRQWDGLENEILAKQDHNSNDDVNFIKSLFPYFNDERYITIDRKPLLIIYRTELFPDIKETAKTWRKEMAKAGYNGIYLVRVEGFVRNINPAEINFDAAMEFAPDFQEIGDKIEMANDFLKDFSVFDYEIMMNNMINRQKPSYKLFRAITPSWDNTPRKKEKGVLLINASPEKYSKWLLKIAKYTNQNFKNDEKILFINAWNEWGEGNHLEPDLKFGKQYLAETKKVLDNQNEIYHNLINAEQLITNNLLNEANIKLSNVLHLDPYNIDALNNLAVVSILTENFVNALKYLESVLKIEPQNSVAEENFIYLQSLPKYQELISTTQKKSNGLSYQDKLKSEIAIYENQTVVHNLPEIHHTYSAAFITPNLEKLTGVIGSDPWWIKEINSLIERTNRTVKVLSLGCGNGDAEIKLLKQVKYQDKLELIGLDINPTMIERANSLAKENGISYARFELQDFNALKIDEKIDVYIANHSLHHMVELEHIFTEMARAASDDMIFLINDMIGRNGHKMWDNTKIVVDELWKYADQKYKLNAYNKRYDAEIMNIDCSTEGFEGIRAEDILPLLDEIFDIDVYLPFGTVVNRFVDRAYGHNFNPENKDDLAFINKMISIDEKYLSEGILSPCQAFIKCVKKGKSISQKSLFQTPQESINARYGKVDLDEIEVLLGDFKTEQMI